MCLTNLHAAYLKEQLKQGSQTGLLSPQWNYFLDEHLLLAFLCKTGPDVVILDENVTFSVVMFFLAKKFRVDNVRMPGDVHICCVW